MNPEQYFRQAIDSFKGDPPDSAYQRGYLAALIESARVLCPDQKWNDPTENSHN